MVKKIVLYLITEKKIVCFWSEKIVCFSLKLKQSLITIQRKNHSPPHIKWSALTWYRMDTACLFYLIFNVNWGPSLVLSNIFCVSLGNVRVIGITSPSSEFKFINFRLFFAEGVTLAQLVKASVGQADVQRFKPYLGHN